MTETKSIVKLVQELEAYGSNVPIRMAMDAILEIDKQQREQIQQLTKERDIARETLRIFHNKIMDILPKNDYSFSLSVLHHNSAVEAKSKLYPAGGEKWTLK